MIRFRTKGTSPRSSETTRGLETTRGWGAKRGLQSRRGAADQRPAAARPWGLRRSAHRVPAGTADGELSRDAALARLEAVLLMAGGSLSSRRLAELAGLADGTQARTLVRRLNELYDGDGPGGRDAGERAAFRVEEVAHGFQLMTRPCYSPWLRRLHALPSQVRLSTSALETLAVIAYRQPVLRAELEAIRGVQCGEMLRQLGERDLVRIAGRSPELGRPFLYGTTKKFLQAFGLRSLDELPRASLRRGAVAVESEPIQSEPLLLQVSHDPTDIKEESAVKIALLSTAHDVQDELLAFPAALPLTDRPGVDPRADEDLDEDDDEELEDDDDDDLEDEEDDEEDDDLEEEEWEEVDDEDEEEEDWEDDEDEEDWDEDEDEDWEEEEEKKEEK